jgi:hypothetical protein
VPEIPADLLPRLQQWWNTIEAGTQAIFEAIYMEAPGAVSNALSGGAWVADSPEPGLAAQLGTDVAESFAASDSIPYAAVAGEVTVTPFHANIGQPVTFTWTEQNLSKADLDGYYTDVYVADGSGETVESTRLANPPLKAGDSAERTFQYSGPATDGLYTVTLYINSEGSDPGSGVPGPQGLRTVGSASFDVGGGEGAAAMQDHAAWGAGLNALMSMSGAPPATVLEQLTESVNWLSAYEGLADAERGDIEKVGGWLSGLDPEHLDPAPWDDAKLDTVVGAAMSSGFPDDASRERVIKALVALRPA